MAFIIVICLLVRRFYIEQGLVSGEGVPTETGK